MMNGDRKKQIEDLATLLKQACEELANAVSSKNTEVALRLLEDCQSSAICLGEMIEKDEGEGFITVSILEEYCDLVYHLHEGLVQEQTADGDSIFLSLKKLSDRILDSIIKDIKVKKEAVFLPYKASMWDALESVWQAADADPEWDAYVIPIPYYDRRPDGSLGQLHYEGSQFPSYVPVTSYREYDLEKRRPDVVFIHNPYDGYNRVTSVHPDFYSEELKKYTGRLVYIPYFVLEDSDTDNPKWLDSVKHFCLSAGVVISDQVYVQSETLRQIYIDTLTKEYGAGSRTRWQHKIYGTGSPKLDRLLHTKKEDLSIPDSWQKLIRCSDGNSKRVILYNTSIASLLEARQQMFIKMQDVFRIFREHQEEAVLWWRPHPLIESTIRSMLPHLLEEYRRLVASYRAEGFGIYDDTSDMTNALMFCDAYYGDKSSLTLLSRKTGKPVMLQNVNLLLCDTVLQTPSKDSAESPAAQRKRMLERPYMEDDFINLYSLLELPEPSDSECVLCEPCGTAIWEQSKNLPHYF